MFKNSKIIKMWLSVLLCAIMIVSSLPLGGLTALAEVNHSGYSAGTQLASPILSSVSSTATGIHISWKAVNGAEKYRVYYRIGSGNWIGIGDTTGASYIWTGAKSGTKYTFTVRCISSNGKSYTSDFDRTGMSIDYVAAPKLASVNAVTNGVQLTWNKVAGAEKYRVFYRIGSGAWTKITDTAATSYTWSGAKSGTKYIFTVRCISGDSAKYTSWFDSAGWSMTYVSTPKITYVEGAASGIQINWGKVTGAEKYRVYYKNGSGNWIGIGDTTGTSYTWTGAKSGTKYTFTVRCITSDGKAFASDFDRTGMSIDYASTPKISSVNAVTNGVQLTWNKVAGAANYRIFYKNANGSWTKIADTASTSYTWTGAKPGTKYTFTVRCLSSDKSKYTSWFNSAGWSITYVSTPKITYVEGASSGIQINWGKVTGAEKYRVYYKNGSGNWVGIGDTTGTSYTWTGAKSGTNYTFTVRCITSDEKAFASDFDRTGMSIDYASAPKISSVNAVTNGVQLTWGKVAGAANYRIFYKNANGSWTKIADTASTSYTWTGAKPGTKYTFTVRCLSSDKSKYTSWFNSAGWSITYVSTPKITYVEGASSGIQINWGKVAGAGKYRVYYKNSSGNWIGIGETTTTSYTWTGAKSGTNYTFTVRCISSDGKSFASDFDRNGKGIKYIAAPKLTSVATGPYGIQITWGAVSGAEKYRVFYRIGNGAWVKIADTTATTYAWLSPVGNTNYTFTVRCINSAGTVYTSGFDSVGKSLKYFSAPKLLYAVNIATGTLVTWEKSAGAVKYRVFYKADGESTWHKAGDTTSTQYTWKGAKSGTKYTFTVRCITSDGNTYTSAYDTKGVAQSTTFTTSKGYQGVVKNGVVYIDGYLIANKTYPLPQSYGNGITSATQTAFNKMRDAAAKDGMNLYISSGFRSYSTQNRIYNNYVARDGVKEADTYSARPGYSEHQSGLALDLNTIGNAFNGTPQAIWLEKNCYKYGFILRYPKGKTNETGYVYESWHFRYVGEELAKKLYNNGNWLTMEDYYGFNSQYN